MHVLPVCGFNAGPSMGVIPDHLLLSPSNRHEKLGIFGPQLHWDPTVSTAQDLLDHLEAVHRPHYDTHLVALITDPVFIEALDLAVRERPRKKRRVFMEAVEVPTARSLGLKPLKHQRGGAGGL